METGRNAPDFYSPVYDGVTTNEGSPNTIFLLVKHASLILMIPIFQVKRGNKIAFYEYHMDRDKIWKITKQTYR